MSGVKCQNVSGTGPHLEAAPEKGVVHSEGSVTAGRPGADREVRLRVQRCGDAVRLLQGPSSAAQAWPLPPLPALLPCMIQHMNLLRLFMLGSALCIFCLLPHALFWTWIPTGYACWGLSLPPPIPFTMPVSAHAFPSGFACLKLLTQRGKRVCAGKGNPAQCPGNGYLLLCWLHLSLLQDQSLPVSSAASRSCVSQMFWGSACPTAC